MPQFLYPPLAQLGNGQPPFAHVQVFLASGPLEDLKNAIFTFAQGIVTDNALPACLLCLIVAVAIWPLSMMFNNLVRWRGLTTTLFGVIIAVVLFFNNWNTNLNIEQKLKTVLATLHIT